MQYYAQVGDNHYRLFSIREGHSRDPQNNYIKWAIVYDPVGRRKIAKEFTIHPHKIASKAATHAEDIQLNAVQGKNKGRAYETLHNFGFNNPKRQLVQLWVSNVSAGFAAQKSYQANQLKHKSTTISFPADPFRPYWISAYFTTLKQVEIEKLFAAEKLDGIVYYAGEFGKLVTLLKFVQPEWELVGVNPVDKVSHWQHPQFQLSKNYERL